MSAGTRVKENTMSDQQDIGRGSQVGDAVVGSTSSWDTQSFGSSTGGGATQDYSPSFGGQPFEQGSGSSGQGQDQDAGAMATAKDKASQMTEQAGAAFDTVKDKASQVTDQASTAADAGMDKAATGLDTLAGTLRDRGESMGGGSVGSIATTAADKLESGAQMLRSTDTEQLMTDLEALVRRKPMESVLVAAGIGFVLSKIVR
jgi:ElaB/YqjD/DUF883 family membrane-anchored ribosome-binding protein